MRPRPLLAVITAAGVVAVGGALFGSRPALVIGSLVTLLVLAGHPALTSAPLPTRRLLWAGLACLAGAVVAAAWPWTGGAPWTVEDLHALWRRPLALAILQLLACLCFAVSLARCPGGHPGEHGPRGRPGEHGPGLIAALGLLVLAAGTITEAQTAWRNRPHFDDSAFLAVAVRTTGPTLDIDAALTAGAILTGAALTVLACAHLARR